MPELVRRKSASVRGISAGDRSRPRAGADRARRTHALFLGSGYAGHRTRFENLRDTLSDAPEIDAQWRLISGWKHDGLLERLPVGKGIAGRARAAFEASSLLSWPRPDVIWSAGGTDLAPFAPLLRGPLRRPLVLDLDWTVEQREELAPEYFDRPPHQGFARRASRWREQLVWDRVTVFTPWSQWAADSLRRQGVAEERIRVLPPGIDLERWQPPTEGRGGTEGRPLRLLFVGGDFRRKGGDMLVSAVAGPLAGECELDIVTREEVAPAPGIRVHRAEPNSPELRSLYASADLFVLPSRAECFGIATIEAMASGLPTVVSNVGASPEIVHHRQTGWVIPPTPQALLDALRAALEGRDSLREMGFRARRVVEERYDGRANDRAVMDLMLEIAAR